MHSVETLFNHKFIVFKHFLKEVVEKSEFTLFLNYELFNQKDKKTNAMLKHVFTDVNSDYIVKIIAFCFSCIILYRFFHKLLQLN